MVRIIGREAFDSFEIMTSLESVFSRRFDFSIDILRNLDGIHSHNVPDLSVVISISNLKWCMTSDFYTLLRGVIEKNFGDVLIPVPETIPIEVLQKPTEIGCDNKYATLSFRLLFDNVEVDCHVPTMDSKSTRSNLFGKAFTPFASVHLLTARISLDVFIDGQSELDLVCVDANLVDTRLGNFSLMFETHIMMRKDEAPVITLVLMHSKLLMMYDWLNDVKNFVTQSADFVPKDVNDPGRSLGSVVARLGGQPFDEQQALSLKITLRDCDLYFLENPHMDNSFAIVMNTTAVLNVNEIGGIEISHIVFKAERADFWLLDDFQGSSIPILRLSLLNLRIDRQSADRLVSSFSISADYFNQRIFGWEPFVEKWSVLRFLAIRKGNTRNLDLVAESRSALDINVTEQLIQQAMHISSRWPVIRDSFKRDDFRRSRSDHLPYLFKNQTGCDVVFTTAVEDIQSARNAQRKTSVRWISVAKDMELTFEFPPRLLLYTHFERESSHQLIVRVNGWDEISPVNVDSCGTYFRLVKAAKVTNLQKGMPTARVVIQVTVEKDGKKVVVVRSSIDGKFHFHLFFPLASIITVLFSTNALIEQAEVTWSNVREPGKTLNCTQRLLTTDSHRLCTSVRREHYPDHEVLPGHTIFVVAPLNIQNLLPIDVEIHILDQAFPISAGKTSMITTVFFALSGLTVDITKCFAIGVVTDRMRTVQECYISKGSIGEGQQVSLRLSDSLGRPLDMYGNVRLEIGGCISISLWVPYWIVNKSGIPLILKQEATDSDAAGQMAEHERAKDKHPLMFSFADDGCPKQCMVRVGRELEVNYHPRYSQKFALTPGVQALKLSSVHESLPTLYYNIGVEVRAGTGRYKDTQVVLLTSRYVINNQSSYEMFVCHHDFIDRGSEHVKITAKCSIVWNENYEDCRQMCVRRSDVKHWSCPFRIDRIGSFHVTMRDADETPRFVRVEIILNSAVFCVTFTNAECYPPPIRIENHSNENLVKVPVLYQQQSESPIGQHLRTICKAKSHVDYAWDDLYGNRRIVLQVYENKSHVYDPSLPGIGPQLVYENHVYLKLAASFKSNGNQLWSLCKDGCIENIGMSYRSRTRVVLDVLERMGFQLMMKERSSSRDRFQKWNLSPVVSITDREDRARAMSLNAMPKSVASVLLEFNMSMRAGIGISLVNGSYEELIYARFEGIALSARHLDGTYQLSGSVDSIQFAQASDAATSVQQKTLSMPPNTDLERPDPFRTRRWYFGTLDLEMGQIALMVTVSKSTLPPKCRQLKQQFNVKLISFEKAAVYLPPFRQFHYFETSSFLLESLRKFYLAELQKQTLNIVVTLDAFGNPQGLVTDLKDSFQGLFIEGDLQRFVAGLGYGVSNSISKLASSAASGVGALTFDQEHEAKRRHNIIRSHRYVVETVSGSQPPNTGALRGITTGAVDTVTKPVQGLFDLVEGTASAMKELAGPATGSGRRLAASARIRPPRLCRNLYHLLPPYSHQLANAQMEMMRINGHSTKERLLDVEVCLEQINGNNVIRQYVLISTKQCYVCRQVNSEPSNVIFRIPYKYLKTVKPRPELENSLASLEVIIDTDDRRTLPSHIWCGRYEVARRLGEKMMQAKREYDHSKRTLSDQECSDG
ncbi:unnamed protein product [Angiostrongylus costaricensis]|uniref:Ricin B-type lectin domain-containing protein n=1 Tax=Angiostrongylus costaricensis TaxID=334426 RepID=A0A0R3PTZ2_ANGCS|nr:unnamed protein product [Angiostrongylus costaricensis]